MTEYSINKKIAILKKFFALETTAHFGQNQWSTAPGTCLVEYQETHVFSYLTLIQESHAISLHIKITVNCIVKNEF